MAVFTPRETQLLKSFLLAMKEFKKFPKLEYTGVRTAGGKIKVVYKQFALQFIRWRFPFTQHGEYTDDNKLVDRLAKDDTQNMLLRDAPAEDVEPLSEKEVGDVEKASEAPAHLQSQQLDHIIASKHAVNASHVNVVPAAIAVAEKEVEGKTTTLVDEQIDEIASQKWKETEPYTPETPDLGGRQEKEESLRDYSPSPQINIPEEIQSPIKTGASNLGISFQKNIGKHLTAGNIGNLVSGGLGAVAGGALGGPLGAMMGGAGGLGLKSWVGGGNAGKTLSRAGRSAESGLSRLSDIANRSSVKGPPKKFWMMMLAGLLLFSFIGEFTPVPINPRLVPVQPGKVVQPAPAQPPPIQPPAKPLPPPILRENHACVTNATYEPFPGYANIRPGYFSHVCGHCGPIHNANDVGINPAGGTEALAVVDGRMEDSSNPVGGTALWLVGDDRQNYYYAHLQQGTLVTGRVKVGQVIARIAAASDRSAKNNGVAHVHFSAGTPGNRHTFGDPANIPAGPLLDVWCGIDVCKGKPNAKYKC